MRNVNTINVPERLNSLGANELFVLQKPPIPLLGRVLRGLLFLKSYKLKNYRSSKEICLLD